MSSQITKFCCLISNHPSLTLCLLYRIMQLRSGHVTLLRTEFQSLKCPKSDVRRRTASHWALPHISGFALSDRCGTCPLPYPIFTVFYCFSFQNAAVINLIIIMLFLYCSILFQFTKTKFPAHITNQNRSKNTT